MRLARLKIHALPGIEPGFTFEPCGPGVNIVTGPNAIGKSSLARALGYLLHSGRNDPPALSLEAEFESGENVWRVARNGSQIVWHRNGESADPPALPDAGLYRLSVEQLLADDEHDRELARELRNRLRGGFDLDAPRLNLKPRFARNEASKLIEAEKNLRQAEGEYDALERQEAEELPRLNKAIQNAEDAQERRQRLQQGLRLHEAIAARQSCTDELKVYSADMDKLRGDERERLAALKKKAAALRDELRDRKNQLQAAEKALQETGLQQSAPHPERLEVIESDLRELGNKEAARDSARRTLAQTEADLKRAQAPFNDTGTPPKLDAHSLGQAEAVATPLIKAQGKRDQLQLKLDQAGAAPDEAEISRLHEAGSALRAWLAAVESGAQSGPAEQRTRLALLIILIASGLGAGLAWLQQALPAMMTALVAFGAAVWGWFTLRRRAAGSPAEEAKQRFIRTGLTHPPDWTVAAVSEYLRVSIEKRYNELVLQRERAASAGNLRAELEQVERNIETLRIRKRELAGELGFGPEAPSVKPDIFVQDCRQLAEAESRHEQARASLDQITQDMAAAAARVSDFLAPWRSAEPISGEFKEEPQFDNLQVSFQHLKQRASAAMAARQDMARCEDSIRVTEDRIGENQDETGKLFVACGLEAGDSTELDRRLDLLGEWREKRRSLEQAEFEEQSIRSRLEATPGIIEQVEAGEKTALQSDYKTAEEQANRLNELIEERAKITTRLKDAGADHRLSKARAAVDAARVDLQDRREHVWLHEATEVLLDDVEQAFQTKNEPETLKRARDLFEKITAHAFALQLDKAGAFFARDLKQQARRDLGELSSGTRMQLLLALRLAWIGTQEQDRETLPLFLDEALTTSDEARFTVMAGSLERLAKAEGRQIFYLSARRHECALWRQATGNEPPTVDLALTRFPQAERSQQDYAIELPPELPPPQGRTPEAYASVLGVPLLNPRLDLGAAHLFHLLRDELKLLHQLMGSWRITSLGQLEGLLDSDAAAAAIPAAELQDRLRQRCRVARVWTMLWRQGRGRPVNRGALEQSGIVSETFIDRVAELAETVNQDGKALLQALEKGQVSGFRTSKTEALERWLADEGYTDPEEILPEEERRRLTLQQLAAVVDSADVNQVITWLESASHSE